MARRFAWWKLIAFVVLTAAVIRGGACGACRDKAAHPAPDERLANHFRGLCQVAEDGIDDPRSGVRKLMRYYGDHGPDMLEAFGATLVLIERIEDDELHDARARLARQRIQAPIVECEETWVDFGDAIEADPEASRTLEEGVVRLGRTLEIIFGEGDGGAATRLADPRALVERFALPAPR